MPFGNPAGYLPRSQRGRKASAPKTRPLPAQRAKATTGAARDRLEQLGASLYQTRKTRAATKNRTGKM